MTSYVEGALVRDDKVVHLGRISQWSLWHLIALGVVLLPLFGLGLVLRLHHMNQRGPRHHALHLVEELALARSLAARERDV